MSATIRLSKHDPTGMFDCVSNGNSTSEREKGDRSIFRPPSVQLSVCLRGRAVPGRGFGG